MYLHVCMLFPCLMQQIPRFPPGHMFNVACNAQKVKCKYNQESKTRHHPTTPKVYHHPFTGTVLLLNAPEVCVPALVWEPAAESDSDVGVGAGPEAVSESPFTAF